MSLLIEDGATVLFQGDSITEWSSSGQWIRHDGSILVSGALS